MPKQLMQNKRLLIILSVVVMILLVPFVAMQFTDDVSWTLADFVVSGVLLSGTGMICDLALRKIKVPMVRMAACAIILLILVIIWMELAVGIFGTPFSGQ